MFGELNFVQPPVWTVTGGCIVMFKAILAFNFVGIGFFKAYSQFRNVVQEVQILIFFFGTVGILFGGLNFVQSPVWTVTGGCIVMFKAILAFNFVVIN